MRLRFVGAAIILAGVGVLVGKAMAAPVILVKPLIVGSPSSRYVDEFLRALKDPRAGERETSNAPSGRAAVKIESEYRLSFPLLFDESCHSVWLSRAEGPRRRILRLLEGDPGSGSSFYLAWSSDSRAVFLSGSHSGFNCSLSSRGQELRIIYTIEDGVAWELPAGREAK